MKFHKFTVVLFLSVCAQLSAIDIHNGKPEINAMVFRLDEPASPFAAAALGGGLGGAAGALLVAFATKDLGCAVGAGLIGLGLGSVAGIVLNTEYRSVYNKSNGKTIHGAAAENNPVGIAALHNYSLKGDNKDYNIIGRDEHDCTPLMYAVATGSKDAAKTIIQLSPATTKILDSTGSSISTSAQINTAQGTIDPVVTESAIKTYKDVATIDLVDDKKQTAAHYAALTNRPRELNILIQSGADLSLLDKRGRSVAMLSANKPALLEIINAE